MKIVKCQSFIITIIYIPCCNHDTSISTHVDRVDLKSEFVKSVWQWQNIYCVHM